MPDKRTVNVVCVFSDDANCRYEDGNTNLCSSFNLESVLEASTACFKMIHKRLTLDTSTQLHSTCRKARKLKFPKGNSETILNQYIFVI